MKKILVTGATGFIGQHVIRELLALGYQVIATSSSREKASGQSWFQQTDYVPFDFRDLDDSIDYFEFFHQPHAVIHLAWEGLPNYKNDFHLTINYPRHLQLLRNLLGHGLKDLTVTGTCFEYGMQEGRLSEDMITQPANPYAIAKDNLRKGLQLICTGRECSLKWVRLFYMFGEGQSANSLLPQLDRAIAEGSTVFNMSGGEQQRDFLPVQQVAKNIIATALQQEVTGVINCCSGVPVKVKDFVAAYLAEKKSSIRLNLGYYPYADFEPMNFWGDNSKLGSILKRAKGA